MKAKDISIYRHRQLGTIMSIKDCFIKDIHSDDHTGIAGRTRPDELELSSAQLKIVSEFELEDVKVESDDHVFWLLFCSYILIHVESHRRYDFLFESRRALLWREDLGFPVDIRSGLIGFAYGWRAYSKNPPIANAIAFATAKLPEFTGRDCEDSTKPDLTGHG